MSGGGLIGGQRMLAFWRRHLGEVKVEDLPVPFVAVTTDLSTGHEIWLQEGRLAETLRTAISLPGVFTPVRREAIGWSTAPWSTRCSCRSAGRSAPSS